MATSRHVAVFLTRLKEISATSARDWSEGMRRRHQRFSRGFIERGRYPGDDYIFVGNSFNLDLSLVGTEKQTRRRSCIAWFLERCGDRAGCAAVQKALDFPGFPECLSRFELEMLLRMPASTLIGPSYDEAGNQVPDAFCIWRRLTAAEVARKELVVV